MNLLLPPSVLFGVALAAALHILTNMSRSGLRQPLPSNLPIESIPTDKRPQPWKNTLPQNDILKRAVKLHKGAVQGTESVAIGPKGTLFMLDRYGYVLTAADVPGAELTTVAYVGPGRPLGFHLHNSSIYICDSLKGLTKYDLESGKLSILANAVSRASQIDPGSPISYANDLDIASDGTVYFTDSTAIPVALNREGFYDTMKTYLLSFLQGGASGRLIKYSPATGEAVVLVPKLSFANGVALAEDESYVLAVETSCKHVVKHWLAGPKAGTTELLIDNLPGMPDGMQRASDGNFWITLVAADKPLPVFLGSSGKFMRWVVGKALQYIKPPLKKFGMVVKVSGVDGHILQVLQDKDASHIFGVSGCMEHAGKLYMGHLMGDFVSVLDLKEVAGQGFVGP